MSIIVRMPALWRRCWRSMPMIAPSKKLITSLIAAEVYVMSVVRSSLMRCSGGMAGLFSIYYFEYVADAASGEVGTLLTAFAVACQCAAAGGAVSLFEASVEL